MRKIGAQTVSFPTDRHWEAVDFSSPSNPLCLLSPHYLWNYQQARGEIPSKGIPAKVSTTQTLIRDRRSQQLLIDASLVPTLFWWLWCKFRLNIVHMLFLNVSRLVQIQIPPLTFITPPSHQNQNVSPSSCRGQWSVLPGQGTWGQGDATPRIKWRSLSTLNWLSGNQVQTRSKSCLSIEGVFTTLFSAQSPVRSPVGRPQKLSFIQSLLKQFGEFSFKTVWIVGEELKSG